jgi:hypothetical protein
MRVTQGTLIEIARHGIAELRFSRRREKFGWSPYRRALISNDMTLLNSAPGQLALHFKPPMHPPPYPWITKNLVCCWDILWQDWRMIPVETCDVITVFPTAKPEDVTNWWIYFGEFLAKMSASDKMAFMNR